MLAVVFSPTLRLSGLSRGSPSEQCSRHGGWKRGRGSVARTIWTSSDRGS